MTVEQASLARRLIVSRGRMVTFIKLDTTPADNSMPWRGATDPRANPSETATVPAVFVPPSGAARLGFSTFSEELLKRSNQIAVCAAGSYDLETFDEVIDTDTTRWKVIFTETLQPATVRIIYFVGLSQ